MKNFKIYFTSDIHGYFYPTDYGSDATLPMGGLALCELVNKDGNTLVIDGGDTIQGSPLSNYIHDELNDVTILADMMNTIGYDYVTLGNHDFNYGYDYLMTYLDRLEAKVLCGNVKDTSKTKSIIMPYHIKTLENGLKIGIIGVATDFIPVWEQAEHLINFEISDTYKAVESCFELVKEQSDVVIGIYHGGFEYDVDSHRQLSDTSENIAYKLCQSFDFDLLMTGHQHIPMAGKELFGTAFVQTPMNGTSFIEIDGNYSEDGQTAINTKLIRPSIETMVDSTIYNKWQPIQDSVQVWLDQFVGHLDKALEPKDHLTMALEGCLVANFLNQIQLDETGADISCTSLANKVLGLSTEVTLRDIATTYIYPNTLKVLEITGEILKSALEQSASYFTKEEGQIGISDDFLKPKVAHYNYDYFSGVTYIIDINQPVGSRVSSMVVGEEPLDPMKTYTIAMNNYRSSGTGNYGFYTGCKLVADIQVSTSEMVVAYIKKHPKVTIDQKKYYDVIL